MFDRRALIGAIILVGVIIVASPAYTQEKSIVVASTTSTQDSGLFEYLLPFISRTKVTCRSWLRAASACSINTT
jgi:tungstate transport system substrate-binding protein